MTMQVKHLRSFHTNQPFATTNVYEIDGVEVYVRLGHIAQTWDCQPYRDPTTILGDFTPEQRDAFAAALKNEFPKSPYFAELPILERV